MANKATGRRPLVQACLDRRNWLFLPVVGVLVLGLLSMSGFWDCVKSDEGKCEVHAVPAAIDLPRWFNASCPLVYQRIHYDEMARGEARPYLMGERQRPGCVNCDKDELWSHFCQFRSHGPRCPPHDQQLLFDTLLDRAKVGAPGSRELLELTPCDLFPYIRGRTLWLVGDSMMQEFMRALQCFMYEFWDLETKPLDTLIADKGATEGLIGGWCVLLPEQSRICHVRSNMGDWLVTNLLPRFARLGALPSDIMILNFAVWINKAEELAANVMMWAEYYQRFRDSLPFTIWRDASIQHFDTPTGDYKCDGCVDAKPRADDTGFNCKAMDLVTLNPANELETTDPAMQVILEGGWRNRVTLPVMEKLGIPIVHTWNLSVPLWQYHHSFQEKDDCTHWCHPSGYQVWIAQMHQTLRKHRSAIPPPGNWPPQPGGS
ncbi:hypothetical protein COCSUDRAFT_45154 [Coccomyxa subellipsoidea C-169]|uniref:Uncharacterized protein n=1 Tax=Coccomyxa subellipsoidea (strain C-169) TaxID=574566 RepID=I0YJV1_COCSC|nr:hypothetical protein COCSUDRAFT_45154 [Coccomyxa subellipsoidea C-169]EIE18670.1 hypothetical protein COCSUDRAFT_45154 [Coccomyxa subellipsoidea C-169]|eukprot:XP_005643214.1 hypothetical protein COCSUDRAFT_45154 [Coccomyxa subellipsoidea C-169]